MDAGARICPSGSTPIDAVVTPVHLKFVGSPFLEPGSVLGRRSLPWYYLESGVCIRHPGRIGLGMVDFG